MPDADHCSSSAIPTDRPFAKADVVLAPMAGITDRPFRILCREHGADATTSEMVSANPALRGSRKTEKRLDYEGEQGPRIVQIAGADPATLAHAAQYHVELGADVININMGCPAKKVCNVMAGSALLQDEALVTRILEAVVAAVSVPVSLKIRTGTDPENRNGVRIAQIAEQAGIHSLAVHGRTRADAYKGEAEYETIAAIRRAIRIPLYANGDITSPQKAERVLQKTGADGVMIGRACLGNPWLFNEIKTYLQTGTLLAPPSTEEFRRVVNRHLTDLYAFYGEFMGLRIARKHIRWYLDRLRGGDVIWKQINRLDSTQQQRNLLDDFLADQPADAIAA